MKIIKIVLVIALFMVALALGAQNQVVVNFNYLLAQGEFHLSTLLGAVFVVGFVLAWIIVASIQVKSRLEIRRLTRQLKKSEKLQKPSEEQA